MALAGKRMCEGESAELLHCRINQLLLVVAQGGAPQPGQALNVLLARRIPDMNAFAAFHDNRTGLPKRVQIGVGVDQCLDIAHLRIREVHNRLLYLFSE